MFKYPFYLKATFDGENPECIVHSMSLSQKKLKKENGGIDVLSDRDVFNQSRALIGAGWFEKWTVNSFTNRFPGERGHSLLAFIAKYGVPTNQ